VLIQTQYNRSKQLQNFWKKEELNLHGLVCSKAQSGETPGTDKNEDTDSEP
jgi:hypothetical protein